MEMEIISREIIKPSSPTPPHLKNFPLSFIDHITFRNYVPLLFFYDDTKVCDQTSKISHLKNSLSQILSIYYPFAGRFKDQVSIECNDQGVSFLVANIGTKLSTILQNPNQNLLNPLFPDELQWKTANWSESILAIQINCFACGRIVISVCACHKIIDASTAFNFVNDWAEINREKQKSKSILSILPYNALYAGGTIFPRATFPIFPEVEFVKHEAIVCKRFVFEASKIKLLKGMMVNSHSNPVKNPTRVEVVTALIYKCAVSALGLNFKTTSLRMAVDLRRRMVPPLLDKSVGNLVWFLFVINPELHDVVCKIREGLCEFCEIYPKKFGGKEKDLSFILECLKQVTTNSNAENQSLIIYASWCRFPMYEADFGWGKPIWVTTSACPARNAIVLMDTRDGDGIEALVNMEQNDMVIFQRHVELCQYASLNPSIIANDSN
ncbi:epi-neemfruitin B synthase L1AT-like [Cicer arietinum]|uniref:Vinorine synthase-like n=1 Tax=Cicer arietinum TaxID=3827 RepID=A0A1S2YHG4_CICAR|nr:vinorine synthase-like [Cicer arietinum]